jgi:hypothetical protein
MIEPEELIPAKHAEIFWNRDRTSDRLAPNEEVLVLDRRTRFRDGRCVSNPRHLWSSYGAMCSDWMKGDPYYTPEALFARAWLDRKPSPAALRAALREFSKIRECDWARRALAISA